MLNKEFPDVDVYLSHSVEDEQTYSEYDGPDWVTEFRAALETSLARELGRETTIWQSSTHLENGSNLVDENLKALENAKVLVVVLSPAYFTYGHSSEKAVSLNEFQMFMRLHEGALEVTPAAPIS